MSSSPTDRPGMLSWWSPWAPVDGLRWLAVLAVGHVAWFAGWWGASREAGFEDQFPWAFLSVAGLLVVAYGDINWILRARGRITARRATRWPEDRWEAGASSVAPAPEGTVMVVAGPGTAHYHDPDCQFAAGKGWAPMPLAAAEADGRLPCGACRG